MKTLFKILILIGLVIPTIASAALTTVPWRYDTVTNFTYPYPDYTKQQVGIGTNDPSTAMLTVQGQTAATGRSATTTISAVGGQGGIAIPGFSGGTGGGYNFLGGGGGAFSSIMGGFGGPGGGFFGCGGGGGGDIAMLPGNEGGAGGCLKVYPGTGAAIGYAGGGGDVYLFGGIPGNDLLGVASTTVGNTYLAATTTAAGTLVPIGRIITGYASSTAISGTSLCISTDCRTAWPIAGLWQVASGNSNAIVPISAFIVGVGTTTPRSVLSVSASSSAPTTSLFAVASSTNSTLFNVLGNGNVGLGTTSPYATLSVTGNAAITGSATTSNLGLTATSNQVVFRYGSALTTTLTDSVSASSKTITLPNITGTLASLSGVQTFTGTKTFSSGTTNIFGTGVASLIVRDTGAVAGFEIFGDSTGGASGGGYQAFQRVSDGADIFAADNDLNQIKIGDAVSVASIYIDGTTGLGVGTTSPWRKLSVVGTVAINGLSSATNKFAICLDNATKEVVSAGNTTCITSSAKTKHDIAPLFEEEALKKILALKPVAFTFNDDGSRRVGFIAEQVDKVDPRLVEYAAEDTSFPGASGVIKKGDPISVQYGNITALLVSAFQNFAARMSGLEEKLEKQQKQIESLQAQINELKK